jgi:hypothetical protein
MKKKVILLSIILFPSLIYLLFEMTKANFKKMAYFGPKTVNEKGDTVYYSVPDVYFVSKDSSYADTSAADMMDKINKLDSVQLDTNKFSTYVILFIDPKLKKDGYKLAGIYDYLKYKAKDLREVPLVFISDYPDDFHRPGLHRGEFDSLKINSVNFYPFMLGPKGSKNTQGFLASTYFKQKPYYVLDYFAVLVDKQRHIRGYYDPTFNAEIKRMITDYKHLKIRDGYAQTLKQNDIKQNDEK